MEKYADYKFYTNDYKGTAIPETAFDKLAIEASFYINSNDCCFNRITDDILADEEVGDLIRRATCAVAEISYKNDKMDGIASEKTGNESISYTSKSPTQIKKQQYSKVKIYLGDTGLMYKGVYR